MSYYFRLSGGPRRVKTFLATAFLMSAVGCGPAAEQPSGGKAPADTVPAGGHGITGASAEGPDFTVPADVPEGEHWRYGLTSSHPRIDF